MKDNKFVTAIILAAGCGSRMASNITKQKMEICGKSVLWHSVKAFSDCPSVDSIVVVCRDDELLWAKETLSEFSKIYRIVPGGNTRADSAEIGFNNIPTLTDYIAIHDGARCLITNDSIDVVVKSAYIHGAATAASPITDTLKSTESGIIKQTVSREGMYSAQTPQVFRRELYQTALEYRSSAGAVTDDNMLIENMGLSVAVVDTGVKNIKITTMQDLEYAEYVLSRRGMMKEIRVGHGYDVHRFAEGRRLIIGGVDIPYEMGLLGHSDADVLVHAIMDSLLGAAGLGDIGRHFPDSSEEFKGISSLELLRRCSVILAKNGCEIINIDATLVMQKPKIATFVSKMIENIATILNIEESRINIKATTEEHLGFTGRMEGVSAHAVACIKK